MAETMRHEEPRSISAARAHGRPGAIEDSLAARILRYRFRCHRCDEPAAVREGTLLLCGDCFLERTETFFTAEA